MNWKSLDLGGGLSAMIDASDYEEISSYQWHARWHEQTQGYYAQRMTSRKEGKQRSVQMHRQILAAPKGSQVDHVNGITLDNRRINLRFATASQNSMNSRLKKNSISGFKGVSKHYQGGWQARITAHKKCRHLGIYKTPQEAHLAYCYAAVQYHGEFARFA